VLKNSGGFFVSCRFIFSHKVIAAKGLKPDLAASSRPIATASLSCVRLLGSAKKRG